MDLQFDDESRLPSADFERPTYFSRLVLKTGLVKDQRQAQYVLLTLAILFLILSGYLFMQNQSAAAEVKPAVPVPPAFGPSVPLP